MKIYSYRRLIYKLANWLGFAGLILTIACSKEPAGSSFPAIQFETENGVAFNDTMLPPGGKVYVHLKAGGGGSNLTWLGIRMDNGSYSYVLDTGFNTPSLDYRYCIYKGNGGTETWTFAVMNRDRNKDSVSLRIARQNVLNWGPVNSYNNVVLYAQQESGGGGFLSLGNGNIFTYNQAQMSQSVCDLVYYYGDYNATFASPGESDAPTYYPGLLQWTVRNETRYDTTSVSASAFYAALNDSLLLAHYNPVNGKRKAKFLTPGTVISFRTQNGKTGLALIKSVNPGAAGSIECEIKVQQ